MLLINACATCSPEENALLKKALSFGDAAHSGQVRKASGQPYFIHPLDVAIRLYNKYHDIPLAIAALLHDTVEDNEEIEMIDIYREFGDEVGFLVDSVTKNHLHYHNSNKKFSNKDQKLFFGGMKDIRCFLLKIADRENNLLTLSALKNKKQIRISFETQAIYAPLLKILRYDDKNTTIHDSTGFFQAYLQEHNITIHDHVDQILFRQTFEDFNRSIFDQAYTCSENIVWEVHNLANYEQLCHSKQFDSSVTVLGLYATAGGIFIARFKFLCADIMQEGGKGRMRLSSFST